tara:strand:- start:29 stop:3757 length:3729 start_codon:yes stop_codon:yes gene_type:complete
LAIEYYVDSEGRPAYRRVDEATKKKSTNKNFANDPGPVDPPEVDNAFAYAFKLGVTDTYRGVKQIAGVGKDQERANQKKLNELMRGENGGWVAAAYFGGALLDPASWLIPFGKAKSLYQMGKYGMVSGAIAGATGYVDEDNPYMDTRFKQAAFGAAGGAVVGTGMGTIRKGFLKSKGRSKELPVFTDRELRGLPKFLRKDMTEDEMMARGYSKVQIQGASTGGRAVDEEGVVKGIETEGKETLDIRSNVEIGQEPESFFDSIIKKFSKNYNTIPFPYTKRRYDIPQDISKQPIWALGRFINAFQKNYEDKVGRKILKKVTTGEGGTAFAGGAIGFTQDFSDDGKSPALSTRFGQAIVGATAGYSGIKFLKSKTATETLGIRKETVLGEGNEQEVFIESIPELLGRLFVDRVGVPKQYRSLEFQAQGLENSLAGQMVKIAKKMEELTPEENKLLLNLLEGDEVTNLSTPFVKGSYNIKGLDEKSVEIPEKIRRLAAMGRSKITKMTQRYIDLGLIDEDVAIENQKRYLMRLYRKISPDQLKGGNAEKKALLNLEIKKIGDELRTRGLVKEYSSEEYLTKLRFDKNTIDGVVDNTHKGWELPKDIEIINGKLYRIKLKTKVTVDKETRQPMFEEIVDESVERKLLKPTDKVELRWQYSKPERKWLGEIENAAISTEYTGLVMSRTIAKYQFFSDVARKYSLPTKGRTQQEMRNYGKGYFKIPEAKIDGTEINKYGKLAGKYVPQTIYKDIVGIKKYQDTPSNILWEGYKNLNRLWKVSKTAWNPTVHVNNILGNVILSDLADVPIRKLPRAYRALVQNANGTGDNSDIVELAKLHGVLDADFLRQEIKNFKTKKLGGIYTSKGEDTEWNTSVGFAKNIYKKVVNNEITGKLEDWYKFEDHVFRLNAFMHRIEMGDTYDEAALFARKQFIDYDINAPAINALRNSVTPFLSFTYRMIPILSEAAIMRPTKFIKYAVLGSALTQIEGLYDTDKQESKKERALLNDWEAGNILDLPFMPKKTIRIPMKDQNGRPKFVNISRLFPGGDVLSMDGKNAVPFLPEPLQPSFGVAGDFLMSMIGYDIFRGQKDANRGDGQFIEETLEAFGMFGKKLIPNFPYVPGSYSTIKLERARVGEKSKYRVPQTEIEALMNSFGVKVSNKSVSTLKASQRVGLAMDLRRQKKKLSNLKKDYYNKKFNKEEYKKKVARVRTKIKDLQLVYFGRLQGEDPYGFRWFDDLGIIDMFKGDK